MPIAEPFSFKGLGNGFPFCLTKVDVNEVYNGDPEFDDGDPVYVDWITLGGWSKDNGAPAIGEAASKSLSLQNASELFYNLNGLTGVDDEGTGEVYTSVLDLAAGSFVGLKKRGINIDLEGLTPAEKIALGVEPKDRVCGDFGALMDAPDDFDFVADASVGMNVGIVRMYEGDVENELNFRGYGLSGEGTIYTAGIGGFPDLQLTSLAKYRFGEPPWLPDKTIVGPTGRARAYGELYGIHFLGDYNVESDVDTMSIEFVDDEVSGTFSGVFGSGITMRMKDFTFYTYP